MNKLIHHYPIVLKKELAVKFGIKKAIIIQQIFYWINYNKNNNRNFINNQYWTYNTLEDWQLQLPFWSLRTMQSILSSLKEEKIIKVEKLSHDISDHTLWYTIDCSLEGPQSLFARLLHSKHTLLINPELATKIGLNLAIVLQQIAYWVEYNQEKGVNLHNDCHWVYQSFENWQKQLSFFSERTLKDIFLALEKMGLILKNNFNENKFNKTNWYTINQNHELFINNQFMKNPEFPDNAISARSKDTFLGPNNSMFDATQHEENRNNSDNAISARSTMQELHNLYTTDVNKRETRTREDDFYFDDFTITESEKENLMNAYSMTDKEIDCAFNEFKLSQRSKTYYFRKHAYKDFDLWCSRFIQVKKPEHRKRINKTSKEEMIDLNYYQSWISIASKHSNIDKEFFEKLIETVTPKNFKEMYLYTLMFQKNNNGFLGLYLADFKPMFFYPIHSNIKYIASVIKGLLADLKGIELYPTVHSDKPVAKIEF